MQKKYDICTRVLSMCIIRDAFVYMQIQIIVGGVMGSCEVGKNTSIILSPSIPTPVPAALPEVARVLQSYFSAV